MHGHQVTGKQTTSRLSPLINISLALHTHASNGALSIASLLAFPHIPPTSQQAANYSSRPPPNSVHSFRLLTHVSCRKPDCRNAKACIRSPPACCSKSASGSGRTLPAFWSRMGLEQCPPFGQQHQPATRVRIQVYYILAKSGSVSMKALIRAVKSPCGCGGSGPL